MKKRLKKLLLLMLFLIFSISLISCKDKDDSGNNNPGGNQTPNPDVPENPGNQDPEPVIHLNGLDLSGYIAKYEIGEEFDSTGLKAVAHYEDDSTKDVTSQISIDTSKFDKTQNGTYEIIVTYIEENIIAKSFFLAIVGTGIYVDNNQGDYEDKIFGPGSYILNCAVELQDYVQSYPVVENSQFVDGFYTVKGSNVKRANISAFAFELPKAEEGWIEFEVNGTATVTIVCASTGSENISVIGLYDSESSLVANNEGITDVTGNQEITITYVLTTGYYRLLSPAGMANSTRGVRVYSISVVQE